MRRKGRIVVRTCKETLLEQIKTFGTIAVSNFTCLSGIAPGVVPVLVWFWILHFFAVCQNRFVLPAASEVVDYIKT